MGPADLRSLLRFWTYNSYPLWVSGKGFRDDVTDRDLGKMQLRPNFIAGYPQIYILDPDRNIIVAGDLTRSAQQALDQDVRDLSEKLLERAREM